MAKEFDLGTAPAVEPGDEEAADGENLSDGNGDEKAPAKKKAVAKKAPAKKKAVAK